MAKKPTKRKAAAKSKAKKSKARKPAARKAKATAKRKAPARKAARRKAPARKRAARKTAARKRPARKAAAKPAAVVKATAAGGSDKDNLIGVIQSGTGSSKKAAADTLSALLDSITASLKKNQKVQLVGFGSFEVARRRARMGRNPATGAAIRIKASKSVRFRAGTKLKSSV